MKIIENNQKCVFFRVCLLPGRRLLLTPGMGMGGGRYHSRTIWNHSKTMLSPFWIYFKTILGSSYDPPQNKIKQKSISLKWHMLTLSPLFDREHINQPLIWTENNKNMFPNFEHFEFSKWHKNYMFIYTENDTESHRNIQTSICNPKHTQNAKLHFNLPKTKTSLKPCFQQFFFFTLARYAT